MSKINLNFQKTVKLKSGKKVVLRYPKPGDVDSMLEFVNKIVAEDTYVGLIKPYTYERELKHVVKIVKKMRKGKEIHFAAFEGKKYLGSADVSEVGPRHEHVGEFGISLLKDVRGEGLGRILSEEVIKQAKETLGLKMLKLSCFAVNDIALSLYKSLGFKEYGRLPNSYQYKGKLIDEILMHKEL